MSSVTSSLSSQQTLLSYISWLQLYQKTAVSDQTALIEYNQYVLDWYNNINQNSSNDSQSIVALYQNLLSEIVINYTTADEKRFLSNIDFTNNQDLDIVIPFFATKIKEISQYLVAKREEVKQAKIKYNTYGSSFGIEKNIQNIIYNLISNNDFKNQFTTTVFPTLSTLIANMSVNIVELYDTSTYFDQTSANNSIDPLNILNLRQAIIDLLATYPLSLGVSTTGLSAISASSTPQGFSLLTSDNKILLINVERSDINDLPIDNFVNAVQSITNLNLSIQPALVEKYMGTTFYYLSTGSTTSTSVSGILFTPSNYYANLLNRYNPSQAIIPNTNNFYTIQEIGSFFTPDKIGLLSFVSFSPKFQVKTSKLSTNTLYIFPDPNIYEPKDDIIHYQEDISTIKADNSNGILAGDIVDNSHQKFYPYQSREESLKFQPEGLSRSYDSLDFFTGTIDSIWNNIDLYPVIPLQSPSFQTRINDLIISDDIMVKWQSDIFGNEFGLYKKIIPKRNYIPIPPTNFYSTTFEDPAICRTFASDNSNLTRSISLSEKQKIGGILLVRNNQQPYTKNIVDVFNLIFTKYQTENELMFELANSILDFSIVDNVIYIQTPSYIIIEKYFYNYKTGVYEPAVGKKTLFKLTI